MAGAQAAWLSLGRSSARNANAAMVLPIAASRSSAGAPAFATDVAAAAANGLHGASAVELELSSPSSSCAASPGSSPCRRATLYGRYRTLWRG